jgi:hypothetical protein
LLPAEREQDARRAGDERDQRELQHEQRERAGARCAEAAQHGRGVQMAAQVTRRRERDGHRSQHDRDERRARGTGRRARASAALRAAGRARSPSAGGFNSFVSHAR